MRIVVTSVLVDDQQKALDFYTDKLGFEKKTDLAVGGGNRWLTVVSPEDPEGVELLLEPDANPQVPSVRAMKEELRSAGIPATSFGVDDVEAEVDRLREEGVEIVQEPTARGPVTTAIFDDTCGNLIQIAQTE